MTTENTNPTTKKQITKKQNKNKKSKTDTKKTISNVPFVVMSCKTPNGVRHKKFRENKLPTRCVLTQRMTGEWHILCWTTSDKLADRHHDRVIDQYIDSESNPERFIEQRYADVKIVNPKFEYVVTDETPFDSSKKEDRSWARTARKLRKLANVSAIALPFLSYIGDLSFADLINFIPLS